MTMTETMAGRMITRSEELQLEGLRALARRHVALIEECRTAMLAIAGPDAVDFTSDTIFADFSIDWMLAKLDVQVVD